MTAVADGVRPDADARAKPARTGKHGCKTSQPTSGGRPTIPSWRERRLALGLSLREVEERTDINRGTLSQIERGYGPRMDHARRLLAVYDGMPRARDED